MLKLYSCKEINIWDTPLKYKVDGIPTIGKFLEELLIQLLYEQEGFSGKRPFGDSDWMTFLYDSIPLDIDKTEKLKILMNLVRIKFNTK